MADTSYSVGTVTVANGGTTVTGVGTAWAGKVFAGELFTDPAQGLFARVTADAISDTSLSINPWPGTALSGDAYEILFMSDGIRQSERSRQLLDQLSVVQANGRGLFYRFDDTITDSDPGAGLLRLNNAAPGSATAAFLDNLDADGGTVSAVLDTWDDTGSTDGRGQLWLRSVAEPATFHAFDVTGAVVDGTGYRKLTIEYIGGSGSFAAGDELMVIFLPVGQGEQGLSAYEVAVAEGFVGDEAAWLASLEGADGNDGTNGTNGTNGVDGTGLFSRVRVVATSNIAISTALNNGDSIDGVTLATNDLVLVSGQTAPAENGIYVVGAVPARDSSFDTYDEHPGVYVSVMEGTANADTLWRCTSNKGGTLGTTALVFEEFSSGGDGTNRNLLHNGDFTCATRGTSFTSETTPANSDTNVMLDRWRLLSDGNDIVDVSKEASVVPVGSMSAIALDVETANKKFGMMQILTQADAQAIIGGEATFSFKAKVSSTTKLDNVKAAIIAWSGSADSPTKDPIASWGTEGTDPTLATNWTYENTPANLNLTTNYQTITVTASIDTAGAKNVAVLIWSDVTDTTVGDFLYVAEAKLEQGSKATPFMHRSQAEEELACAFFLRRLTCSVINGVFALLTDTTSTFSSGPIAIGQPMRVVPTVSFSSSSHFGLNPAPSSTTLFSIVARMRDFAYFDLGITGGTAGAVRGMRMTSTSAWIEFDAEIGV